jgi:hypothetical protein
VFKGIVLKLNQQYVLTKKLTIKKKSPWISKQTEAAMKLRSEALKDSRANVCKSKYKEMKEYTRIRSQRNTMVRIDNKAYDQKVLNSFEGNPKKFYGYVSNLKIVKAQVTRLTIKMAV